MMPRRSVFGLAAGAALSVVFGTDEAHAAQVLPIPLSELVAESAQIWVATPLESHAEWVEESTGRYIVTWTRVRCDGPIVEREAHDGELFVRTLGGTIGRVGQLAPGEARLALNEPCLVFLRKRRTGHVVAGMAQGHFALGRDEAGVLRLRASASVARYKGIAGSVVAELADRELSAAVQRVQRVAR
ncbi:MAG: hypothetical protein DIU78_020095 [Pseudomonadota bacterium]